MIRNLISPQLKILSLSLSLSLSLYIYIYILFYRVFLYILRHNFFFFFFSLPIINNSHSLTIFMLFRNLTLLFFFPYYLAYLMFLKSIVEVFIKPTIQTILGMYFSTLFVCFLFCFLFYKFCL